MATGDLKNNFRKLKRLLREVNYKEKVDEDGMCMGLAPDFLEVYHYIFINYSPPLKAKCTERKIQLDDLTDIKFVESMYRVMRDIFDYKPVVPKDKFFSTSYAERKVLMCIDILSKIKEYNYRNQPRKVGSAKSNASNSLCVQKTEDMSVSEPLSQSMGPLSSSTPVATAQSLPNTSAGKHKFKSPKRAAPSSATSRKTGKSVPNKAASCGATGTSLAKVKLAVEKEQNNTSSGVKVVLNSEQARREGERHKMRAMDMVGKTPVRPNNQPPISPDVSELIESLTAKNKEICERLSYVEGKLEQLGGQGKYEGPSDQMTSVTKHASLTPAQVNDVMALIENAMAKWQPELDVNQNVAVVAPLTKSKKMSRTSTMEDLATTKTSSNTSWSLPPVTADQSTSDQASSGGFSSPPSGNNSTGSAATLDKDALSSPDPHANISQPAMVSDAIKQVVRASVSDSESSPSKPISNSYQVWMTFASIADRDQEDVNRIKDMVTSSSPIKPTLID